MIKFVIAVLAMILAFGGCASPEPSPTPPRLEAANPTATPAPPLVRNVGAAEIANPAPGTTPVSDSAPNNRSAAAAPEAAVVVQLPDIAGVVEKARPAVVSVVTKVLARDFFGRVFEDSQSGSGVIFDPRGYILTNNHVVQGFESVTVTLDDGRQFEAEVAGMDQLTDLAVLKISGEEFATVLLGDPSKIRVGDWVVAIGNALALPGGPTVTAGVVSALDREFPVSADLRLYGLIQTDASINPGNSGGPLLDLQGEVVGINTTVARGDRSGRVVEGIGFAIGMDTAMPVAQQLMEEGRVHWSYLGVGLGNVDAAEAVRVGVPFREGVVITGVGRDSPAWRGGLRIGDVIVSMGGKNVSTVGELIRVLRHEHNVGDKVEIVVFREKRKIAVEVTLGERPTR